jgi:putative addiction module killer protein
MYTLERTGVFKKWFRELKDVMAIAAIQSRVHRAADGNFGDWKPIDGEVREMRIRYGGGYRVYYTIRNNKIIFLLCGGDKSSQKADIEKAKKLVKEI